DGLALYPAQPSLQNHTESRTDVLSATRIDATTYMLEKPGDYRLPPMTLRWWNVRTNTVETAQLDAIALHVADDRRAPRAAPEGRRRGWTTDALTDVALRYWPWLLAGLAALVALAFAAPGAWRRVAASYRQRRDAYRASEAWAFRRLAVAARR